MKDNPADIVTAKILEQTTRVSERIAKQLKNTKPFAREVTPPSVKIWAVDNLGIMDMIDIRNEFGDGAIGELIAEAAKLRADGRRAK